MISIKTKQCPQMVHKYTVQQAIVWPYARDCKHSGTINSSNNIMRMEDFRDKDALELAPSNHVEVKLNLILIALLQMKAFRINIAIKISFGNKIILTF